MTKTQLARNIITALYNEKQIIEDDNTDPRITEIIRKPKRTLLLLNSYAIPVLEKNSIKPLE